MQWLKQSTAVSKIVGPILDSTGAEYASAVIGDLSLSKNGATLTALASAATLTYIANGYYTLALTTGNTDTLGSAEVSCNKSTYQMPPRQFMTLPSTVYDALVTNATTASGGLGDIQRLAGTVLTGRDIGASVLLSSGTGTGQLKLASGYVSMTWADIAAPTTSVALTGTTISSTQKVDVETIKTNPVVNGGTVTFPTGATLASTTNITAGTVTTATTATNLTNLPTAPTDWLTAAAVKADAVTKVQTGLSTYAGGDTAGTTTLLSRVSALRAGYLDNLSAGAVALASGVTLSDGVTHGGTTALLRLGSSSLTPAFYVTNTSGLAGDAVKFEGTAASFNVQGGDGMLSGVITGGLSGNVTGSVGSVVGAVGSVTGLTASRLDAAVSSRMATYTQPTGFLAATFPGTVASTTNITGGTVTTVTNLTNSPTTGDFTATMKTSIGTAVAASAVASVTGIVGGIAGTTQTLDALQTAISSTHGAGSYIRNTEPLDAAGVRTAVGLASANLDTQIAAVSTKTANLPSDPADASDIAASFSTVNSTLATIAGYIDTEVAAIKAKTDALPGSVFDLATSGHTTSGTFGAAAVASASSGDPWGTNIPGAYGSGTAGYILGNGVPIADGAITDAKFTFPAESSGRPTTFLAWVRRIGEWVFNKRSRNRSTGDITLRNAGDTATLETQTQSTTGSTDTQTKGV